MKFISTECRFRHLICKGSTNKVIRLAQEAPFLFVMFILRHVFAASAAICSHRLAVKRRACFHLASGEQRTYKCLSCPFSTMTISQLKEHSLRDHGEVLTLPKLRAASQAAHAAVRASRPAANPEQTPMAPDGMRSSLVILQSQITPQMSGMLADLQNSVYFKVFNTLVNFRIM